MTKNPSLLATSLAVALLSATAWSQQSTDSAKLETAPSAVEPPGGTESTQAVPDTSIGLVAGSVFEVFTPEATPENDSAPGERPLNPRPSVEWPPSVPHSVADWLPITRSDNQCIDCHAIEEKGEGDPTPIPQSHYMDLRNTSEMAGEAPDGARWICVSCHVGQTDAEPLVDNSAHAAVPSEVPGEKSHDPR